MRPEQPAAPPPQPSLPFAELQAQQDVGPPPPRPTPTGRSKKVARPFGPRDESDLVSYHAELEQSRPKAVTYWWESTELKYRMLRFGMAASVLVCLSVFLRSGHIFIILGCSILFIAQIAIPVAIDLFRDTTAQSGERVTITNNLAVPVRVYYEGKYLGKGSDRVAPHKTIELQVERGAMLTVNDERTDKVLHADSINRSKTIVVGGGESRDL